MKVMISIQRTFIFDEYNVMYFDYKIIKFWFLTT